MGSRVGLTANGRFRSRSEGWCGLRVAEVVSGVAVGAVWRGSQGALIERKDGLRISGGGQEAGGAAVLRPVDGFHDDLPGFGGALATLIAGAGFATERPEIADTLFAYATANLGIGDTFTDADVHGQAIQVNLDDILD